MEIKVNDYVRIVDDLGKQFIGKVYNVNDYREPSTKYAIDCQIFNDYAFVGEERIVKSSPNIIDLIEVGDYVNGYKVVDKGKNEYDGNQSYIVIDFDTDNDELHWGDVIELTNEDIKSVLTKEMFEQMEYKID